MNQKEKDILTLLDETPSNELLEYMNRYMECNEEELNEAVKKFLKEELIQIIKLPWDEKEMDWYFFTDKVDRDCLNDDLRYQRDRQMVNQTNYAKKKLREFQKDKTKKTMDLTFER